MKRTESLTIKELREYSSDSLLSVIEERREGLLDYGRIKKDPTRRHVPVVRPGRRNIRALDIEANKFMDVLLFFSAMILWMSGVVMLGFGLYLVLSEYHGWEILTKSTMYGVGMLLQTASALCILTAAGITTSLFIIDTGTPRRAFRALIFVVLTALLLISEIIVCSVSKENQRLEAEGFYATILHNDVNRILGEQNIENARKKGYECKKWDNKICLELYRKYIEMYTNFLIGSASVTLGITIIVGPVLFLIFRTSVRSITRVLPISPMATQSTAQE